MHMSVLLQIARSEGFPLFVCLGRCGIRKTVSHAIASVEAVLLHGFLAG